MSHVPAIYLAFANDDTRHLDLLDEEHREVWAALRGLNKKGTIQVVPRPRIDSNTLEADIQEWEETLAIFHYAGHAESKRLIVHGQEAHAEGLAGFLGEAPNLQLVFLNGCSTHDQVDELIDRRKVGAVIATSVDVRDDDATQFSIAFYQALARGKSILKAFHAARNSLYKGDPAERPDVQEEPEWRGIKLSSDGAAALTPDPVTPIAAEAVPWRLYCKKEKKHVLSWRLPTRFPIGPFVPVAASVLPLYFVSRAVSLSWSPLFGDWLWSLATAVAITAVTLTLLMWSRMLRRRNAARFAVAGFLSMLLLAALSVWAVGGNVVLQTELTANQEGWLGIEGADSLVLEGPGGQRLDVVCLTLEDAEGCSYVPSPPVLVYGPRAVESTRRLYAASASFNHNLAEGEPQRVVAEVESDPSVTLIANGDGPGAVPLASTGSGGGAIWRPRVRIKAAHLARITGYLVGYRAWEAKQRAADDIDTTADSGFACSLRSIGTISRLLLLTRNVAYCAPGPVLWSELRPATELPVS